MFNFVISVYQHQSFPRCTWWKLR